LSVFQEEDGLQSPPSFRLYDCFPLVDFG
jgi:hypothetical protein